MVHTRRTFLKDVSAATAAGWLARRPWRNWAMTRPLDDLPEPDEARMRALALKAIDAARAAGAEFADIRINWARYYGLRISYRRDRGANPLAMNPPVIGFPVEYGIRAIVNGSWGFASGATLETDAIVEIAQSAVDMARGNRARHRTSLELAPMPVVSDGVWETPIERDPLTVSYAEQGELGLALLEEAARTKEIVGGMVSFDWRCPTVVFAATNGSVLCQRIRQGRPGAGVTASAGSDIWSEAGAGIDLAPGGFGYEVVRPSEWKEEIRAASGRAVALAQAARNPKSVDVGRYDVVFSADAVAETLIATMAEALNLERALGYRAGREGTSFAAPPMEMLGKYHIGSPLLTVRGDRSRPMGAATVKWDDEGVAPNEYALVQDGVVVDYHTDRQMSMEIADWYRTRNEPVRSHGCARRVGEYRPIVRIPNLTMTPAPRATNVDDLIRDVRRGFYVDGLYGEADQQVITTQSLVPHTQVREIRNGRLGEYVKDFAYQFITTPFWKGVDAIGDAASARSVAVVTDIMAYNDPSLPFSFSTVNAVPVRVRQVNVLNTGRTQ